MKFSQRGIERLVVLGIFGTLALYHAVKGNMTEAERCGQLLVIYFLARTNGERDASRSSE